MAQCNGLHSMHTWFSTMGHLQLSDLLETFPSYFPLALNIIANYCDSLQPLAPIFFRSGLLTFPELRAGL